MTGSRYARRRRHRGTGGDKVDGAVLWCRDAEEIWRPAACRQCRGTGSLATSDLIAICADLSRCIMLPERMRARRASSSGEPRGTAIVATHGAVAACPNAGTRRTTRHVNPTAPAALALNSAKASTVLLCCCGARVCKGYNREQADGRQIAHYVCPPLTAYVICSV